MASRVTLISEFHSTLETLGKKVRIHKIKNNTVPHAHLGILHIIAHHGSTNIKQLAEHLCLTSSAATQNVNTLVTNGLLKRIVNVDDRRQITLSLTTKGMAMIEKTRELRLSIITKLCTPLTIKELATLTTLLKKISV